MNEDEYWRTLRTALRNLYDHAALRRNALAAMLAPATQGRGLQEILLDAVQALNPGRGAAVQSDARRTYQILQHRYVEQFSQGEVADSLGLSERQLRRQEQLAIRTLGEYLRVRYELPIVVGVTSDPSIASAESDEETGETGIEGARDAVIAEPWQLEIDRLQAETPLEVLPIADMIEGAVETLQPMLLGLGINVANEVPDDLPGVNANAVALRQALMITLSTLARSTSGKQIVIATQEPHVSGNTALSLAFRAATDAEDAVFAGGESLSMARQLLTISGGDLTVQHEGGELALVLTLPTAQTRTILIIDDNQDSLQLCQRYLTGTVFQPVGTRDPLEGLALAERIAPEMILLDVMMPSMDGWETLARLRRHPATENVPVVIFTILPEESLATALGAVGFLRKPFTREELLGAIRGAVRQ